MGEPKNRRTFMFLPMMTSPPVLYLVKNSKLAYLSIPTRATPRPFLPTLPHPPIPQSLKPQCPHRPPTLPPPTQPPPHPPVPSAASPLQTPLFPRPQSSPLPLPRLPHPHHQNPTSSSPPATFSPSSTTRLFRAATYC